MIPRSVFLEIALLSLRHSLLSSRDFLWSVCMQAFCCLYLPIFSLFLSLGCFCFTSGLLQQLLNWSLTPEVSPSPILPLC